MTVLGQPVLIDFQQSIFSPVTYASGCGSVLPRNFAGSGRTRLRRLIKGTNRVASEKAVQFLARLRSMDAHPKVLIIGGGTLGSGTEALYQSNEIELIGMDVYASPYTKLVGDAHRLPFRDKSFDGVWIQAVLEYVLDPKKVVSEMFRVLRPGGLVYADSPFMQQVHDPSYDFNRWTLSGHRWLFKSFEQIDAGAVGGAGTAFTWSARYLLRALGFGDKGATLVALPLFWFRFLDGLTKSRENADAASAVYFFGLKSERMLTPKEIVMYYDTQPS